MDKFIAGFILAGGIALCISGFTAKGLPLSQHKRITGRPAEERVHGSVGLAVYAAMHGVRMVRVHDVAATVDAIRVVEAVTKGSMNG